MDQNEDQEPRLTYGRIPEDSKYSRFHINSSLEEEEEYLPRSSSSKSKNEYMPDE